MIFDHRTYTCRAGTLPKQLAVYREQGFETQTRHLGQPFLYGTVETGNVNSYIHVWAYEDAADRARKRAAMAADPQWQAYLQASAEAGYLISQENKILQAVPFVEHKR